MAFSMSPNNFLYINSGMSLFTKKRVTCFLFIEAYKRLVDLFVILIYNRRYEIQMIIHKKSVLIFCKQIGRKIYEKISYSFF